MRQAASGAAGRRARFAHVAVVAAAVLAALVAAPGVSAVATAAGKPAMRILVMGDSYSAGNGAGDYSGAKGCYRSGRDYGQDYAAILRAKPYSRPAAVTNVACSGAVTADFFRSKSGRPPELDAVNGGYDLIFLTVGGNDADFADIVKYCLIAKTRDGANCNPLLGNAERLVANGTMKTRITNVLKGIRARANPGAKVVLLGYPFLEGDTGYTLRSGHGDKAPIIKVGQRLHALGVAADTLDQQVVSALNAGYPGSPFAFVSVHQLFDGPPYHGLYAKKNNPNRWMIQPFVDGLDPNVWYHPNPTGWREEANLLAKTATVPKTPKPVIVTKLPAGTAGQAYSAALTTTDHRQATWSLAGGAMPPGLALHGFTVSGTPKTAGTYRFSVRVTDTDGRSVAATVSIAIAGTWAAVEAPLPAGATVSQTGPGVSVESLDCPAAGECVALEDYQDPSGDAHSVLLTGSGTSWKALQAPLPPDAAVTPTGPGLYSVACPSVSACVAVGEYTDSAGNEQGLLVTGSGTSWRATRAPLPADASASPGLAGTVLDSVACSSASDCAAVGGYLDSSGHYRALLVTGSGTSWHAAGAPLPADAGTAAALNYVACSDSLCAAAGSYTDSSGDSESLIVSGAGSSWTATKPPLPPDSLQPDGYHGLSSVACGSASCVVVGQYYNQAGDSEGLLITGLGSAWRAVQAPMPADRLATGYLALVSAACTGAGGCVAIGDYTANEPGDNRGVILTGSGTSWKAAEAPVPAGSSPQEGVGLSSVACASPSACVVAGGYTDSANVGWGLLLTGSASSWHAQRAPLPGNVAPNAEPGEMAGLSAVACASSTACDAVGGYFDSAGYWAGLVVSGAAG